MKKNIFLYFIKQKMEFNPSSEMKCQKFKSTDYWVSVHQ